MLTGDNDSSGQKDFFSCFFLWGWGGHGGSLPGESYRGHRSRDLETEPACVKKKQQILNSVIQSDHDD